MPLARDATPAQRELFTRLDALRGRLSEGLLRVAVLGQFKRGKSTLLNALLGISVLPTGVTPVTSIPAFIRAGPRTRVTVAFKDKAPIVSDELSRIADILQRHISEIENPHNHLDVESVEIEVRSRFLESGIVFIDTPGVGSTFLHNTQTAEALLRDCDSAIFVVSPDPPITQVEVAFLEKVQKLIPKVAFVLNKIDTLEQSEIEIAQGFLADTLRQHCSGPVSIFPISARAALKAKEDNTPSQLAKSGISQIEAFIEEELAWKKQSIMSSSIRTQSIALVAELAFLGRIEHNALLMPEATLTKKAELFESSISRFNAEQQSLSDRLSIDRKRLLRELEAETERLWTASRNEIRNVIAEIEAERLDDQQVRDGLASLLTKYFEDAFSRSVAMFRSKFDECLSIHQSRASQLIDNVRQTAADLMEIAAELPPAAGLFEAKRDPYWVAPERPASLIDLSANLLEGLLPAYLRKARARERLISDSEKAALHNIGNLEWAIRQDIEDSCRQFEAALSEQLRVALARTQRAMQAAIERRASSIERTRQVIERSEKCLGTISDILDDLQGWQKASLESQKGAFNGY